MALVQEELKITKLKDLFDTNLSLPSYQRPYRWGVKSTNTLFNDTYEAFKNNIKEYRLGTIILHKEKYSEKYNIVDGQQRLTTLSILLYCLNYKENQNMLKERYCNLSKDSIITNYVVLSKRIKELNKDELEKYKDYLLNYCTFVQIVTNNEQEAFQFFDSQNLRGKELAPHDLLKSYHLREMNSADENTKISLINKWENLDQNYLSDLFKNYLYPLIHWYKKQDGLGYSSSKIDSFKGIKAANHYNYSIYHKASNIYVEQFNSNVNDELIALKALNQFQLTQPLIAGKRFFGFIHHYENLLQQIQKKISSFHNSDLIPDKRSGDIYIKQLYECSLLLFADRFGIEHLDSFVMQLLYSWSYSLRLEMYAVYPQTINKYAKGLHERLNFGIDMFYLISEMNHPDELKLIILKKPVDNNKYTAISNFLYEENGWS